MTQVDYAWGISPREIIDVAGVVAISFGAAGAGVKCAISYFRDSLYRIADDHMDSQEREIDNGIENRSMRIVRKVMSPVIEDVMARIDRFEERITGRVEKLSDAIHDLALHERDREDHHPPPRGSGRGRST